MEGLATGLIMIHARIVPICSGVGIQWRADDNYVRRFCAAVVDLLLNFDLFW